MSALGQSQHESLIKRTLDISLSGIIRNQDVFLIIHSCAANPKGNLLTWNYIKEHYNSYDRTENMRGNVISSCIQSFKTIEGINEIKEFFEDKDVTKFNRKLLNGIEGIKAKVERIKRDITNLSSYSFY